MGVDPPAARIRSSPAAPGPPPSFGAPYELSTAVATPQPNDEEEEPAVHIPADGLSERVRAKLGSAAPLLDPGTPGLRVLVLLGLLAAVVAGIFAWRSQPVAEPVGPPMAPPSPVSAAGFAASSPSPASSVTVYVTGKVRRPGVLALRTGSRVVDAIEAAGGVRKGATPGAVNLARRLVDGEQIVVGAPATSTPGGGQVAGPVEGGVLNLNTATAEQLNGLPGVGDVLAQRIVEFREAHGGFRSVDQLREVSGIGQRKFAELKDRVAA
ncbi:helix-hairpin-helix domain-containing protein [Planotetraspora sp. GP83]|uniref:helix-hairpin-helix domain-containing protein n=1 Tax=Planotetraspora sp. GP83 TaxID=3156264 RepID=UPI003514D96B